jgi:hypothetical protein
MYVIYQSHLLPPKHTRVIYATSVLIKDFRIPPPNYVCVSTPLFCQITARCSRYWAFTPSLASKVSPSLHHS